MESGDRRTADLAGRPLQRGTRARGEWELEFSRIVAFSDGVFAIAITLLVLTLDVPPSTPDLTQTLLDEGPSLLAYLLSFAVIGRLWLLHHRLFAEVTHFDGVLIVLNLGYLGLIALIPFTTEVLGEYGDQPAGVIPYAINVGLTNLVGSYLVYYAVRKGLTRPGMEWVVERPLRWRGFVAAGIFLVSVPVALVSPVAAIVTWALLFFSGLRESLGGIRSD